jgi:hypothetical protein
MRSWLEAAVDRELQAPPADDGLCLEALVAAAAGSGANTGVLSEGLSVSQGHWPLDK